MEVLPAAAAFLLRHLHFLKALAEEPALLSLSGLAEAFAGHLGRLLTLAVFGAACAAAGWPVLRRLAPEKLQRAEAAAFSCLLGAGLSGYAAILLGWVGLLHREVIWILTAAAAACFFRFTRPAFQKMSSEKAEWPAGVRFILAYAALLALPIALAPPVIWDALAHHLAGPLRFVQGGRIGLQAGAYETYYALHGQAIWTWAWLLAGMDFVPVVGLGFSGCFVAGVYFVGRRLFGPRPAALAAALTAAWPALHRFGPTPYSDVPMAAFSAAGLWAFCAAEPGRPRIFFLAGLLFGFSGAVKYNGLAVLLGCAIFLLSQSVADRRRFFHLGALLAGAALSSGPWLLRNWIFLGHPFWYQGMSLDANLRDWNSYLTFLFRRDQERLGVTGGLLGFLRLPWDAVRWLDRFSVQYGEAQMRFFLAVAIPLGAWGCIHRNEFRPFRRFLFGLFVLATLLWFGHGNRMPRIWMAAWPPLALAAASVLAQWSVQPRGRVAAWLLLGLAWLPVLEPDRFNEGFVFLGSPSRSRPDLSPRQRYVQHHVDVWEPLRWLNQRPGEGRVGLWREFRGTHSERQTVWLSPWGFGAVDYRRIPTASALRQRLRELDVRFVLFREDVPYDLGDPVYEDHLRRLWRFLPVRSLRPAPRDGPVKIFELPR